MYCCINFPAKDSFHQCKQSEFCCPNNFALVSTNLLLDTSRVRASVICGRHFDLSLADFEALVFKLWHGIQINGA